MSANQTRTGNGCLSQKFTEDSKLQIQIEGEIPPFQACDTGQANKNPGNMQSDNRTKRVKLLGS